MLHRWALRAVTPVRQVSMILIRRLLLHARAARWASTLQRGRSLAVTVQLDMQTRTVILPLHVWPAVRVSMLQQAVQYVWIVRLVHMMTTRTLQLAALAALQAITLQ